MKIIITEEQYSKLNKSNQALSNAIIKYMNQYIQGGDRKIVPKSRNYGNLREDWCVDGKETIITIYYFEYEKFTNGTLIVSENLVNNLSKLLSIRRSYVLHIIEEWYDDIMVPKFEEITGESGLTIDSIHLQEKEFDCIPESVKPEGITDEEMINYIVKNTLYNEDEVIKKIESGEEDLDDLYLHIVDIKNRDKIKGPIF
jgi:hypothetical protein